MSLAHSDGAQVKTPKHVLLNKLEWLQKEVVTEIPAGICGTVYDGDLLIHSIFVTMNVGAIHDSVAKTILSTIYNGRGNELYLRLDKYIINSIMDNERQLRGAADSAYEITGPKQVVRQRGQTLLNKEIFKNEFSKFLLREWRITTGSSSMERRCMPLNAEMLPVHSK